MNDDVRELEGGMVAIRSRATASDGSPRKGWFLVRKGSVDWYGWDDDEPNVLIAGLRGASAELRFEGYNYTELIPILTGVETEQFQD